MPSFNQLMANFLSATNENNAALASLRFDFSLFRVEAPAEWSPIGKALSPRRRIDAETGPVHRTARRLAALFEEIIPSTPKLVAAYGIRVSEIIAEPGINPTGSSSDGPFEEYVGAEGTAMWAAATSGISAIAIYLLACFLARAWDHRTSTSIWVELVEGRKSQIMLAVNNNEKLAESTLMSTLQEITRQDLALWDSMARSWLRSADQVKQWHLIQLQLVTKDVGLQFNEGVTTYSKVMDSWNKAMTGLESFLVGMPQQITDASILLAFSAWHLFPDLIALSKQTTKIPFSDELFPSNAIGTIGVYSAADSSTGGIQWSLALSHLQYYGEPVHAVSQESQPRITFSQFRMVALGALLFKWKTNHRDFLAAALFLTNLWKALSRSTEKPAGISVTLQFGWLHVFVSASEELLRAHKSSKSLYEDCWRLVCFGYRRGAEMLGPAEHHFVPYFGLCNSHILNALREETDADFGIAYLNSVFRASNLSGQHGFISRMHLDKSDHFGKGPRFYEIIGLGEHRTTCNKQSAEGEVVWQSSHPCWLQLSPGPATSHDRTESIAHERSAILSAKGYGPVSIQSDGLSLMSRHSPPKWLWEGAPKFFSKPPHQQNGTLNADRFCVEQNCDCFQDGEDTIFESVLGGGQCGLFLTHQAVLQLDKRVEIQEATDKISGTVSPDTLWSYMAILTKESWHDCSSKDQSHSSKKAAVNSCLNTFSKPSRFSLDACRALHILTVTSQVFKKISRPTISLDCVSTKFHHLKWRPRTKPCGSLQNKIGDDHAKVLPIYGRIYSPIPEPLCRAAAISCITFFDSGTINLLPEDLDKVFAVSCEGSLYVSANVLSDPADQVATYEIRHIVGNIGRKGISMLVAPQKPWIRKLSNNYRLINHERYNYKREDNFSGTTLHLTFTEWTQALTRGEDMGAIDQDVFFVEAVISLMDRGIRVADLDILQIDSSAITIFAPVKCLKEAHNRNGQRVPADEKDDYTSIDTWDELLDKPMSTGILRAHNNWAARLAATSILFQMGHGHSIGLFGRGEMCLQCAAEDTLHDVGEPGLQKYKSSLPQFCID